MIKRTIFQISLLICVVFFMVQCKSNPPAEEAAVAETTETPETAEPAQTAAAAPAASTRQTTAANTQDGIYVGIIAFGPNAVDITSGNPIHLDRDGRNLVTLNNLIDDRYVREQTGGTALFYAAHMGLANMTRAQSNLPKLDHVIMVTFTDGLDVSSTGLSLPAINDPGNTEGLRFAGESLQKYENFIKHQIDTREIGGTRVKSYVTAVRGDDITNIQAFESTLKSVASTGSDMNGIPFVLPPADDMNEISVLFGQIAHSIGQMDAFTDQTFTMVTPQYPIDTRVRMTFGGAEFAEQVPGAALFVEGIVAVQDGKYYLTNIKYGGGVTSDAVDTIQGTIEGNMVKYRFPGFVGYDLGKDILDLTKDLKQWIIYGNSTSWQINSEYEPMPDSVTHGVRRNALVYLVLDRSSSIIPYDIPRVRQAAKLFISMLHYTYYSQY